MLKRAPPRNRPRVNMPPLVLAHGRYGPNVAAHCRGGAVASSRARSTVLVPPTGSPFARQASWSCASEQVPYLAARGSPIAPRIAPESAAATAVCPRRLAHTSAVSPCWFRTAVSAPAASSACTARCLLAHAIASGAQLGLYKLGGVCVISKHASLLHSPRQATTGGGNPPAVGVKLLFRFSHRCSSRLPSVKQRERGGREQRENGLKNGGGPPWGVTSQKKAGGEPELWCHGTPRPP
jgi:hypothetical protein